MCRRFVHQENDLIVIECVILAIANLTLLFLATVDGFVTTTTVITPTCNNFRLLLVLQIEDGHLILFQFGVIRLPDEVLAQGLPQ